MPMRISQLIRSVETAGDAIRLVRIAQNLTQGDVAQRTEGRLGVDYISLVERGKRIPSPAMCSLFVKALGLSESDEEHLILLAFIDKAPERLKPFLRQATLGPRLRKLHAFIRDLPEEQVLRLDPVRPLVDARDAAVPEELLDVVLLAFVEVDGLRVHGGERAGKIHFADHARRAGFVDDDEVV